MRISYLELKNYRKFKELKLQFPDGVIGILGLNGAGKTTIIEGVAWALFGNVDEVVRTSRESVLRVGAGPGEGCRAVLEFELGGTEYRIEREMGGRNLLMRAELRTKEHVLAEGDKPVRRMVEKLIGMDHKSFFTSVFARQKELNALQNVQPGERKKVVLRMLRIDGIDEALTRVRSDRKEALSRVQGAEKTLLTEDGREREKVLKDKLPELEASLRKAETELERAEQREQEAAREAELVRKKRDELKKDVDAYNAAESDLKARRSAIEQLKDREATIRKRLSEDEERLKRYDALEKEEEAWTAVCARKETLERERARNEKAIALRAALESDRREEHRRLEELMKLQTTIQNLDDVAREIEEVERAQTERESSKASISGRIGELKALIKERSEAAEKDRKKLQEIVSAGREGACPTCERRLEDAYELLVKKLEESIASAEKSRAEASRTMAALEQELRTLEGEMGELRKKWARLNDELARLRKIEASIEVKKNELAMLRDRLEERGKELEELGEVRFSQEEYARVVAEYSRLRAAHDEFMKLREVKAQAEQRRRDLEAVREALAKRAAEEAQLSEIVAKLEPKKVLFNEVLKELDEKTAMLNAAKDELRKAASAREKALGDLERVRGELEELARVKKAIERDRQIAEDLAVLEDVMARFKDHLIGRVRPMLKELTSGNLESMTEGRYSKVSLDENYEMQIEDQGVEYPINRFSGGESDLANLSLRLAISSVIADRTGAVPFNVLILDEVFGSLDPTRKRSVMTALARLSARFRQVFLITHIEDIKDSMNHVIRVEELPDGTSRAELVS